MAKAAAAAKPGAKPVDGVDQVDAVDVEPLDAGQLAVGDPLMVLTRPDDNDGRAEAPGMVTVVNDDGEGAVTVDAGVHLAAGYQTYKAVPVYADREQAEAALSVHVKDLDGATPAPKDPDGRPVKHTVHDVLRWHHAAYRG